MKSIRRWFVLACLASASLIGCVSASTDTESQITPSPSQTTVVMYTAEDIARLAPTDVIRIDLTAPETVYVVEYSNPEHLAQIAVVEFKDQYLLSERIVTNVSEGTVNRVIVAGDPNLAAEFLDSSDEDTTSTVHTQEGDIGTAAQPLKQNICCDVCTCSGGTCICTGCRTCD